VQKVGASYVMRKVSDYVMAPPKADQVVEEEVEETSVPRVPDLDGQIITDENGASLGTARRVAEVAVYVITENRRGLEDQLKSTIEDPEGRVFFHHAEDGRLTGLIYVPDPASRPAPVAATRADDI
jgi:hypothetical protein